ncbi:hypothetical protein IFO70_20570 [Phormidium tenue FACHB-886]|nr:hypothetical protein [Phormidium tenue FACHB-886]
MSWVLGTLILLSGTNNLVAPTNHQTHSASLPTAISLEQLPTGRYYYASPEASANLKRRSFVLLRKAGTTVIGFDHRSAAEPACFRGFIEGDRIINATRVLPPYQPDSPLHSGETLDLTGYQPVEHDVSAQEAETLQTCINFFWR